jgi:hypothetical protein
MQRRVNDFFSLSTCSMSVRKEYFLFTTKKGPYAGKNDEDVDKLFIERIEGAIEAENASTLQVLTTVSEASSGRSASGSTGA